MYITKVLSYNGAWGKLLAEYESEFHDIETIFKSNDEIFLPKEKKESEESEESEEVKETQKQLMSYMLSSSEFNKKFELNNWSKFLLDKSDKNKSIDFLYEKNNLIVDFGFGMGISKSFLEYIFNMLKINQTLLISGKKLPIRICLDREIHENKILFGISNSWENYVEEFKNISPIPIEIHFLILGLSSQPNNIELIEVENIKVPIMIERSIEFKPEHYQAGLGILNYFGTVMRKKYPEQNAKVRIEQNDNTVRLVVESANGDKEIIERAFDEFGLVIHQDMKPEEFYNNYLDVAELKTKLGTFESELKFQHQLVEMKEHRIIELQKDKEFLENIIGKALVRPNSPVYINNQLHNSQSTVFNYKNEFTQSYDELEELIEYAGSEALKNRIATIQNALELNRDLDQPEEIKDSGAMKKLAKFLKDANQVGTEANDLAKKGSGALDLIKSLGRRYNDLAGWCGLPSIPSILIKE